MGNNEIRVRMAPSPTGFFHIGTARTALFNWLFAKANRGKFILRIEDTDKERSKPEFEADILAEFKWLGLDYDEFYRQSERTEIYKEHLKKLLDERAAYYCFCSKEDLDAERASLASAGLPQKYSGRCRALSKEEASKRVVNGDPAVIRFKSIEEKISFNDLIRGEVEFDMALVGDTVIAKNLDNVLYNFAVVVDDALMNISHIIRGEDHISNTPKQIQIAKAFGFNIPAFAHLPIILNPDRSKMSKRFLDVALKDYRESGYLSQALLNFLAFLGWHPKEDKEVMNIAEIIEEFSLERVQKSGAVFNVQKLDWLNAYYINHMPIDKFIEEAKPFIPAEWPITPKMAASIQSRAKKLSEIKDLISFYFNLPEYDAEKLKWKGMPGEKVVQNLKRVYDILSGVGESGFNKENIEKILVEETKDQKKGEIFWPLRLSLSGLESSPTPFEIIEVLGKDESLRRIKLAYEKIQ